MLSSYILCWTSTVSFLPKYLRLSLPQSVLLGHLTAGLESHSGGRKGRKLSPQTLHQQLLYCPLVPCLKVVWEGMSGWAPWGEAIVSAKIQTRHGVVTGEGLAFLPRAFLESAFSFLVFSEPVPPPSAPLRFVPFLWSLSFSFFWQCRVPGILHRLGSSQQRGEGHEADVLQKTLNIHFNPTLGGKIKFHSFCSVLCIISYLFLQLEA